MELDKVRGVVDYSNTGFHQETHLHVLGEREDAERGGALEEEGEALRQRAAEGRRQAQLPGLQHRRRRLSFVVRDVVWGSDTAW